MAIYRITRYDVRQESVDITVNAVNELVRAAGADSGTRQFLALQDKVHPNRFTHFMQFEDAAAEARHRNSPASRQFTEIVQPHVVGGFQSRDLTAVAST